MSQESCCSFCEQLPEIAWETHGGSASKCPLCKQALWVSARGVTSRMLSEEERARIPKETVRGHWIAGVAAVLVVAVSLGVGYRPFAASKPASPEAKEIATLATPLELSPPIEAASLPNGPEVQTKPAMSGQLARVKPSWQPPEESRTIAPPPPAPVVVVNVEPKKDLHGPEEERKLAAQLDGIPQVDLDPEYGKKTKAQLTQLAQKIAVESKVDRDAFVRTVKKEQPELAGLPFLMGDDCSLSEERAKALAKGSLAVRTALAEAARYKKSEGGGYYDLYSRQAESPSARFWTVLKSDSSERHKDAIPALQQILFAESKYFRLSLTRKAHQSYDPGATNLLANRAVFDLDPEVRAAAVEALQGRPKLDFPGYLVKALRYPWEPAARGLAIFWPSEIFCVRLIFFRFARRENDRSTLSAAWLNATCRGSVAQKRQIGRCPIRPKMDHQSQVQ